jgi:hypothetical protein
MPNGPTPFLTHLLAATLLGACATTMRPAPVDVPSEPDCSYRSATTCWTVAGRFPPAQPAARDSLSRDLPELLPRILASSSDTARDLRKTETSP